MRRCDLRAVPGDADEPHEALLARLDAGVKAASRAQRRVPVDRIGKTVELDEIDLLHAHPLQRTMDLALGIVVRPASGLRRKEKAGSVLLEPGGDPQLGIAVCGRDVDVIDPIAE
jgi:hypothetical protein